MCSSEHHAAPTVEGDLTQAVETERDTTVSSSLDNDEAVVSSSTLRIVKTTPSKRIRDVNGYRRRAAALCVRRAVIGDDYSHGETIERSANLVFSTLADLEILLVSGRGEKNYWVLPGGGIEKEESTEEAVLREFREEAGIQGAVVAVIGEFTDDERYHRTTVFMLSVIKEFDEWEDFETGRQRRWMGASEALQKIKTSQMAMVEQSLEIAFDILNKGCIPHRKD